MRSIGLDVHKRFAEVAIIEGKGPPVQRRIGTTTGSTASEEGGYASGA